MDTMTETHLVNADVIGTDTTCHVHVTGPYWLEAWGSEQLIGELDPECLVYEIDGFTVTITINTYGEDEDGNEVPTDADAVITE